MGNTIMPQWICVVHDATQGITNAHECYELSWSVVTYKKIAEQSINMKFTFVARHELISYISYL